MAGHVHRRTNLGAIPVLGPWMVDPCCRVRANQRRELTAAYRVRFLVISVHLQLTTLCSGVDHFVLEYKYRVVKRL